MPPHIGAEFFMTANHLLESFPDFDVPGKRRRLIAAGAAVIGLVALAGAAVYHFSPSPKAYEPYTVSIFTDTRKNGVAKYDTFGGVAARPMGQCRTPPLDSCVVDGDTFWLNGEEIRIANIDAPEIKARCPGESSLGGEARRTLVRLLDNRTIKLNATGRDRAGRLIAFVETPYGDVGEDMLRWDVAAPTQLGRVTDTDWCDWR